MSKYFIIYLAIYSIQNYVNLNLSISLYKIIPNSLQT